MESPIYPDKLDKETQKASGRILPEYHPGTIMKKSVPGIDFLHSFLQLIKKKRGIIIAPCAIQADKSACPALRGLYLAIHGLKSKYRSAVLPFLRTWYNIRVSNEPCRNTRGTNACLHAIWTSCISIGRKPASEVPKGASLHGECSVKA